MIIFLGALYLILPTAFLNYITSEHLGKIITGAGSGDVRTLVSVYSLQVFSEAPLFGVGLGGASVINVWTYVFDEFRCSWCPGTDVLDFKRTP